MVFICYNNTMEYIVLKDWMTTHDVRIGVQMTRDNQDSVYHSHTFYEFFYVTEGTATHIINGKSERLSAGDMRFLSPTDVHCFFREKNEFCAHRDIVVPEDQFQYSCGYLGPDLFKSFTANEKTFKPRLPDSQINHFENRIKQIINTPPNMAGQKKSLINLFMVELLSVYIIADSTASLYPLWFEELLARFHRAELIRNGLSEIIAPFNYNLSYVCRVFKKLMGVTMSDYLLEMRLSHAANLLQCTSGSVLFICEEVGFSSLSYFSSSFKRRYGISPKDFRKNALPEILKT